MNTITWHSHAGSPHAHTPPHPAPPTPPPAPPTPPPHHTPPHWCSTPHTFQQLDWLGGGYSGQVHGTGLACLLSLAQRKKGTKPPVSHSLAGENSLPYPTISANLSPAICLIHSIMDGGIHHHLQGEVTAITANRRAGITPPYHTRAGGHTTHRYIAHLGATMAWHRSGCFPAPVFIPGKTVDVSKYRVREIVNARVSAFAAVT